MVDPKVERRAIADLHKIEFRQQRRLDEYPFSNLAAQQPKKPGGVGVPNIGAKSGAAVAS